MTAVEHHTAGQCRPGPHCGCLFALTDMPPMDRAIEQSMDTLPGRIVWALLSLAVVVGCLWMIWVAL